jgi:NADPH:quinone reductase-like Zn-dependent oxidoreductase
MKAILSEEFGLDALELREIDTPAIEDHQVLVRVRASSVNPTEWYRITGPYFARMFGSGIRRPKNPAIGSDLAGTVEVVGKDVTEFQPGDEVFGTTLGAWAEYAPAREVRLVPTPANVSFEEAAAVPIAATTALQALRDHGGVQPGHKVLINGASGGVGTFAVQIAKSLGAEVTAVCSTRNVDLARSLGADQVVDYANEDFTRGGERFDLVIDIAGSRPFRELQGVSTPDATIVVVGAKFPSNKGLGPLSHVMRMRLGALGRSQTVKFFVAEINKDDLGVLADLLAAWQMKPVIDRRFELSETREALRYLGEGHARGKIVLTM